MKEMTQIEEDIYNLYKKTVTSIPNDVILTLKKCEQIETTPIAKNTIARLLENAGFAKKNLRPVCQDTGIPLFYVKRPLSYSEIDLAGAIKKATDNATENIPLRPNSVNTITEKNIGNIPIIHFEESNKLEIELLLKGGGSENISTVYKLPNEKLNANRDFDGVRNCILDAVFQAQGQGCPPYIVGVAVGGNIEEVSFLAKKQLLRKLGDKNSSEMLNKLEIKILKEINKLGIGPMGFGGKTTALAIKITAKERHPATYFVGISFSCWCLRRQKICID